MKLKEDINADIILGKVFKTIQEISKAFPMGAEVEFFRDDGGESTDEWTEIGIVTSHTPTYFGGKVLGYFQMKVFNPETKRQHNAHYKQTKLTKNYIRKRNLKSLL